MIHDIFEGTEQIQQLSSVVRSQVCVSSEFGEPLIQRFDEESLSSLLMPPTWRRSGRSSQGCGRSGRSPDATIAADPHRPREPRAAASVTRSGSPSNSRVARVVPRRLAGRCVTCSTSGWSTTRPRGRRRERAISAAGSRRSRLTTCWPGSRRPAVGLAPGRAEQVVSCVRDQTVLRRAAARRTSPCRHRPPARRRPRRLDWALHRDRVRVRRRSDDRAGGRSTGPGRDCDLAYR